MCATALAEIPGSCLQCEAGAELRQSSRENKMESCLKTTSRRDAQMQKISLQIGLQDKGLRANCERKQSNVVFGFDAAILTALFRT
ncbi:hypothetical protein NDU88_008215 [Pleurodeles waltl]|uniref:Uncharacterized protein n=1 Tax=Pleurodeles waltl TaxID=8319 RepID=A0AAV7NYN4_PLEWA|nr:hypothetical protein NDU88_008215 [Pleurodeles waltl]